MVVNLLQGDLYRLKMRLVHLVIDSQIVYRLMVDMLMLNIKDIEIHILVSKKGLVMNFGGLIKIQALENIKSFNIQY